MVFLVGLILPRCVQKNLFEEQSPAQFRNKTLKFCSHVTASFRLISKYDIHLRISKAFLQNIGNIIF